MKSCLTLAAALLLSTVPQISLSNDRLCETDLALCECRAAMDRLSVDDTDIKVALAYLLSKEIPARYNCSFDIKGRSQKACLKYGLNRVLLQDSLDVVADLPSAGQVEVINTDQAMEVGFVVAEDLVQRKPAADVLVHAGKTYVREKLAAALVWLLAQTNLELLLPDAVTQNGVYSEARAEVARFYVEKALDHVSK